ncbi:TolC family protein [Ferruginibacter paludis]|uniref:TolC family protein n=1 Tax=Ferruginibacter paludis TaxID=1310417 RepID=UPI0025B5C41D|nr:TolC family protein [Ferruginibacter paludis]MDN3654188.1 TolC family protein [Ferruginibacter paludis]
MKALKLTGVIILLLWPGYLMLFAQQVVNPGKVLEQYIRLGLKNNLAMQEKQFDLQKSHLALQEARSFYLPTISFQSDYNLAKGGRSIDLPLGDLLNSAYASLNKLTASTDFKMVKNQQFALMQPVFQDTRIQTNVSLVNQEIRYFNLIRKEAITEKQAAVNVYKRELIKDIQAAYYHYLLAQQMIEIYKNAGELLRDNIRYTEVLIRNERALKSSLLKVQVQLSSNAALLLEAENKSKTAAAYFNFLINAPLDASIVTDAGFYQTSNLAAKDNLKENRFGREEISLVQSLTRQSALLVKKEKAAWLPQVGAFFNAGIQGRNYKMNSDNAYLFGGVQLKWTIYNGSKTSSRAKQAATDFQMLQVQLTETTRQIEVETINKKLELNSALAKLTASKSNQQLALEIYRETQLRYRQGQALSIELLDAFTQLINSRLEFETNQTDILIKQAEVERATASYIFPNT